MTRDGHIVAMHDQTLIRTDGVHPAVHESTLKELRTLDVGSWKSSQYIGERIPTLSELLAMVPRGKKFFVELKGAWEDFEPLKTAIKTSSPLPDQICLICLEAGIIEQV